MINPQKIAEVLLEEITIHVQRITFTPSPESPLKLEELQAKRLADLLADYPLPDVQKISFALEEVFWASLLTEESRPCRPRLLYVPMENPDDTVPLTPSEQAEIDRLSKAFKPAHYDTLEKELRLYAGVRGWTGDPLKQPPRVVLSIARRVLHNPMP